MTLADLTNVWQCYDFDIFIYNLMNNNNINEEKIEIRCASGEQDEYESYLYICKKYAKYIVYNFLILDELPKLKIIRPCDYQKVVNKFREYDEIPF